MGITINGSSAAGNIDLGTNGTITDLAVGGLPDGTVDADTLAAGTTYNDADLRKDLLTLALQTAVDTNRKAYNLQNSFVDQFEDDTGIATETDTNRSSSEYIASASSTAYRYLKFQYTSSVGYPKIYEVNFYPQSDAGGTAISKSGVSASMVTGQQLAGYSDSITAWVDGNESTVFWIDNNVANSAYKLDFGSGVAHYIGSIRMKIQQHNNVTNIQLLGSNNDSDYTSIGSWAGTESGGVFLDGSSGGAWIDTLNTSYPVNATGSMISTANTASSARTKVSGVMTYKNQAGTATLGTDLKIYFTCNGGTNWTEAASYTAGSDFSTGIKTVYLGETTCTSGTDIRYKVEFANQSSGSKETQLHGIGVNY